MRAFIGLGGSTPRPVSMGGPVHGAVRGTETGCLAIAGISGYTSYLTGAELDHCQDVLEDLTATVVRALTSPMQRSSLEGDAVFVSLTGSRVDASMLLDTLDAAYFAVRRRQDASRSAWAPGGSAAGSQADDGRASHTRTTSSHILSAGPTSRPAGAELPVSRAIRFSRLEGCARRVRVRA